MVYVQIVKYSSEMGNNDRYTLWECSCGREGIVLQDRAVTIRNAQQHYRRAHRKG